MRTKKAFKNYLTSLIYMAVTLCVGLITTPILLKELGQERLGAFRAMSDWFGYLGLLEFGLGGSLRALLAQAVGKNDESATTRTLAAGFRSYLWSALAMIVVGWFVACQIAEIIPVTMDVQSDLRTASLLFILQFLLVPLTVFRWLLEARQEDYHLHFMMTFQAVFMAGLTIVFAYQGYGIRGQVSAILLGMLPFSFYVLWRGIKLYPRLGWVLFSRKLHHETGISLKRLHRDTFVLDLTGRISLFTDNIIIAYFIGTRFVMPYVITTRLIQIIQSALQGIGSASWAPLTHLYAQGEHAVFRTRVIEVTELIMVCSFAILGPVAAYNASFVGIWVGIEQYGGMDVTLIAAANAACLAALSFWSWCFTGTGNVRYLTPAAILSAAVNLITSLLLVKPLGIAGPLLGTLISFNLVGLWYFPLQMFRIFGVSRRKLLIAALKPALLGVPFATLVLWVSRTHEPGLWFLFEIVCFVTIYLGTYWAFFLSATERKSWLEILKRLFA